MISEQDREGAPRASTPLETMQRWFQAVISHPQGVVAGESAAEGGEGTIEERLTPSASLDAAGRLTVYADAYFARLIECMGEVFPMMKKFLGEETFDAFAFEYLQAIPSRSYTLHHLGRHFPKWLEDTRPHAEDDAELSGDGGPDWPDLLVDLARLEWDVYETFDGPGMEGRTALDAQALLTLSPGTLETVRLVPSPSLRLATYRFPVNEFYTALRRAADAEDVTPPEARPSWVAFSRLEFVVHRYDLSEPAHALLSAVLGSQPLGEALEAAAEKWTGSEGEFGETLKVWFHQWAEGEFFSGVRELTRAT